MTTTGVTIRNKALNKWTIFYLTASALLLSLNFHTLRNEGKLAWRRSGLWVQSVWLKFLNLVGDDPFNLYVYGMNIWNICIFWTVGLLFLVVDLKKYPKWIIRNKVQPTATIDKKRFGSLARKIIYNQFFVGVPFSIFGYYFLEYQTGVLPIRELPSFLRIITDIIILIPIQELFAYYTHRLFHHRLLYKWTHKIHHEWTAPIALSAYYNHPIDHLICNILPATVGLSILNCHLFTSWLWLTWATLRTLSDHSGYHLLIFPSPKRHDFHHLKFTECFGVWGPLDYFHGTDKSFRVSLKRKVQSSE